MRLVRPYVGVLLAIASTTRAIAAQSTSSANAPPSSSQDVAGAAAGVHEVAANGVRLWYRVAGSSTAAAPPVVFLHGGPGYNSQSFALLAGPRLERSLRMVYLDQRGSGHSERPWSGHYALDTLVEDVEVIRRALGVPQISVIGHSFGGTLALEYVARHPDRVSRLVVLDGLSDAAVSGRGLRQRLTVARPEAYVRAMADTAHRASTDFDLVFRALPGRELRAFMDAMQFHDSTQRVRQDSVDAASGLRNTGELQSALIRAGLWSYRFVHPERLTMPVLVIVGRYDGVIGTDAPRVLTRALPRGCFVEYDRSAHFGYLEEPERFARDMIAFLGAPQARTSTDPCPH